MSLAQARTTATEAPERPEPDIEGSDPPVSPGRIAKSFTWPQESKQQSSSALLKLNEEVPPSAPPPYHLGLFLIHLLPPLQTNQF